MRRLALSGTRLQRTKIVSDCSGDEFRAAVGPDEGRAHLWPTNSLPWHRSAIFRNVNNRNYFRPGEPNRSTNAHFLIGAISCYFKRKYGPSP